MESPTNQVTPSINPMPTQPVAAPVPPSAPALMYAGFWQRFLAFVIDGLLIAFVSVLVYVVTLVLFFSVFSSYIQIEQWIVFILTILYFALMESSSHQGTIGKILVGLKVTDLNGNRISFGRALGRYFGKIISTLIIFIGYLMIAFTEKEQGLHDIIAGTLVVKSKKAAVGKIVVVIVLLIVLTGVVIGGLIGYTLYSFSKMIPSSIQYGTEMTATTTDQNSSTDDSAQPMTAAQYDTALAMTLPADFDTNSSGPKVTAGPALLQIDAFSSDGSPTVNTYFPLLPNLTDKNTIVNISINHVYTKKGVDVYDAQSSFETNSFFTNISLNDYSDNTPTPYYAGLRSVNLIADSGLTEATFGSLQGTLSLTLPLSDGSTYQKTYPFTIKGN